MEFLCSLKLHLLLHCIRAELKSLLNLLSVRRALTGIMDDYFDGYFSEEMIECQVFLSIIFCSVSVCMCHYVLIAPNFTIHH
jgi:hypothetical protein